MPLAFTSSKWQTLNANKSFEFTLTFYGVLTLCTESKHEINLIDKVKKL